MRFEERIKQEAASSGAMSIERIGQVQVINTFLNLEEDILHVMVRVSPVPSILDPFLKGMDAQYLWLKLHGMGLQDEP